MFSEQQGCSNIAKVNEAGNTEVSLYMILKMISYKNEEMWYMYMHNCQ